MWIEAISIDYNAHSGTKARGWSSECKFICIEMKIESRTPE